MKQVGSRAQVMHGTADHTTGGLKKGDLKMNKWGRIVSRKKSARMSHGKTSTSNGPYRFNGPSNKARVLSLYKSF